MITQTINPMVNTPSLSNLTTFESDVDYTLNVGLQDRATEMNTYAAQVNATAETINAQAVAMSLNSTTDTSTSSAVIGAGSKTFTVSVDKSFVKGMYLTIADTAAPSANSMYGIVDSYSGTTLIVNVLAIRGTGTKTTWTISQSAAGVTAETYTRSNILGTVSQVAGVPTDALIETGSNANGKYNKFASGLMVCTHTLPDVAIAASSMTLISWTFPATFIAVPVTTFSDGSPTASEDVFGFCRDYGSTTATGAKGYRNGATAQNLSSVRTIAIGYWF